MKDAEMDCEGDEWLDLKGEPMESVIFNKVIIDELVTKDPITGEFKALGKNCIVLNGVDILDETHKVTVHFDAGTGKYTVVNYERGAVNG